MTDISQHEARYFEPAFIRAIENILASHADGLGEYELIKALQTEGYFEFLEPAPATPHELYRAHFLLYHALYQLNDREQAGGHATLEISPLKIRRIGYQSGQPALGRHDPLHDFYLDRSNLDKTPEQANALIAAFWEQMARQDHRGEALAVLGLSDPVDDQTIRKTYKRLVMTHHPDRGGDHERLQSINAAVDILLGTF